MIALYAKNFALADSYSLQFRVRASNASEETVSNVVKVKFTTKSEETPVLSEPLLSADKVSITANPNSNEEVISINWTSAATAGITPSYTFELSGDESFSDKVAVPVEGDAMYVSYTGKEIAAIAAMYGLGESFTIYARIIATAEGAVPATSNVISVKVKVDYEIPEKLYIYFWAWEDPVNAQEMENLGDGVFTWTGQCNQWQFKFIDTLGEYWTGYFRDGDAEDYWTLKKTGNECMFQLDDKALLEGYYTINVDLNTLKVEVVPHIYPIGAFDWGWGRENAPEMTYEGNGNFTWTGNVYSGDFKFLTQNDGDWIAYNRKDGAENYWTAVRCCDQEGDLQFNIDAQSLVPGEYKVDFNPFTKAVNMTFISALPTE